MIIKKESSRIFVLNLFADFIVSKISHDEQSIINLVDCKNFILVKGFTTSKEILNLTEISNEFSKIHAKYLEKNKITHTIDLIEYNKDLLQTDTLSFTYHNTDNCSYHPKQIEHYEKNDISCDYNYNVKELGDDVLILSSEFPHGYSLGQGRLLYYYGKKITYSIPSTYPYTSVVMTISSKDPEENFSVYDNFLESEDESLRSAVLDVFDFDMTDLNKKLKEVDFYDEILNPLSDYDFLKEINKNFFIV